jgi:hypothetical protein
VRVAAFRIPQSTGVYAPRPITCMGMPAGRRIVHSAYVRTAYSRRAWFYARVCPLHNPPGHFLYVDYGCTTGTVLQL